ncbi:MAG: chromosomal replication initiator protein DnaA [Planctomycetota bacterium]
MTGPADPHREELRRILEAIRTRLRKRQFETWFARTTLLSRDGDVVVLGVPNQFLSEWMTREYRTTVEAAARDVYGRPITVRFDVDGQAPASPAGTDAGADGSAAPLAGGSPVDASPADRSPGAGRPGTPTQGPRADQPLFPPAATNGEPARGPGRPAGPTGVSTVGGADLPTVVLQPHYTFDQFVVGPSNQLPHAVARAVADHPGTENNPLFLYGAVGLGKTHLLQAICRDVLRRRPGLRIAYLSCEQFTNEYVSAVQRNATEAFRARFRNVDMLVIDDIHFLANKERTQEEFFHTFNALYQQRKQIILSSDAAPTEIPTLEDRLVSRFRWGVVAQIEPPEVETRMAIVRRKAESMGLAIPDDVVGYVADIARRNIRELEGALASLRTRATVDQVPIDLALARVALEPLLRQETAPLGIERIATVVATHFGSKVADLRSQKRTKSVSLPRQIAMYLAREETGMSLVEIGDFFAGRDHTTVLYAVERVAERVRSDEPFRQTVERLRDRIRTR